MPNAINIDDSGRGPVFRFGTAAFHSADGLVGLGSDALRNSLTRLAALYAGYAADLKPEVLPTRLLEIEGGPIIAAARTAIEAERAEARTATEAEANFRNPVLTVDPAVMVYHWQRFTAMDRAAAAKAIQAADLEALTALVSRGNKAGLPDQVYEHAVERYRVLNWVERQQLAARHPLQPTPERILATGPDTAAAEADARQQLAEHAQRLDRIKAAEAGAKDLLRFLAATFAVRPDDMLNRVLGRPA